MICILFDVPLPPFASQWVTHVRSFRVTRDALYLQREAAAVVLFFRCLFLSRHMHSPSPSTCIARQSNVKNCFEIGDFLDTCRRYYLRSTCNVKKHFLFPSSHLVYTGEPSTIIAGQKIRNKRAVILKLVYNVPFPNKKFRPGQHSCLFFFSLLLSVV